MRGHHCFPAAAAIAAFLLVPLVPLSADTAAPVPPKIEGSDTPAGKKIAEKLNSIIVLKVNFDKLDISPVLDFLTEKSKELDPERNGIHFRLELPIGSESKKSSELHREVSINLENVPLSDLLGYICVQTNLSYKIAKGTVILAPSAVFSPETSSDPTIKH